MKKLLLSIIIVIWFTFSWMFTFAEDFPYDGNFDTTSTKEALWIWNSASAWDKIAQKYLSESVSKQNPISFYVSKALNYFLGILAFVTALVIMRWFSMVFTNKSEEWLKKWFTFMKMWIIVIIIIWASWLISMAIFHVYNSWVK